MFSRPNYHQRPFNYNPNRPQHYNQQWHQPNIPPYNPTAYQYYAKPKQPGNWHSYAQPKQNFYGNVNQPPQVASMLNQFKDKNGDVDFDKMLSTVGQVANTFKQITPMVKQFGSIMKSLK
ncbi:hypothetical protein CFK37_03245 [Virgibacillus phasianinus]|uniref:Spore coat protein n=1 Tax=Virgibacillus phasianinus TaxID=2017483 RepID=A0A220U054_9BACI|nr:YppG family protein [Virgibacillus phasianinus]ASK61263.1 hypothetical protein CFK37_03245 [Virgibacillus phasianinus]